MRKLLLLPILFLALNVHGQSAPPPPPTMPQAAPAPPERPDYVVAVQMGTATLANGKDTVKLAPQTITEMKRGEADPHYTVLFTPLGDCGQLNITETKDTYFLVKQQKGASSSDGKFDYVVFAKQKRPAMPMGGPMRPGQGGQPPQTPPMPPGGQALPPPPAPAGPQNMQQQGQQQGQQQQPQQPH